MPRKFDPSIYTSRTGRLAYGDLKKLVETYSSQIFAAEFPHPILVGSSLKMGEFAQDYMINQSTMKFYCDEEAEGGNLKNAIFPILRRDDAQSSIGEITIGRTDENDLVMNDFSISKRHAKIITSKEGFNLIDLESRNGVTINDDYVCPKVNVPFKVGQEVGFGRYQFLVMAPETLYARVKNLC